MEKSIVVIGGGAAGLMAAITAARQGAQVTLLEPNERLGKKVNITGKGRCNVTNDCDRETLLANIPGNGRFLYSALTRFTPQDTMAFFRELGVPLKVERGNRVFPVSDSAFDITNALERELKRRRVRWARDRAMHIKTENGAVTAELPLPVAGLMSDAPLEEVNDLLESAKAAAHAMGVPPVVDPFMTLSFMSLPVIPALKITTQGVFDVEQWKYL